MDKKSILLAITGLFIFLTAFAQRSEDRKEYIEKKYTFFFPAGRAEIINGGTYTTTNDVNVRDTWAYCVNILNGAKLTVNGGSFTGNHGVIAAVGNGSEATLNAGEFNCTATYTGNSDWVLYAENGGSVVYDAAKCTLTTANPSGPVYSGANVAVK